MTKPAIGFAIVVLIASGLVVYLLSYATNRVYSPGGSLSLIAVGDSIGYNVKNEDLSSLAGMINDTDIFIFNLEGVLRRSKDETLRCEGFPSQSVLTSDASFAKYMKLAPVTIANMANNHVLDCGSEGIESSKRILSEHGLLWVGAGSGLQEACQPLVVNVRNRRVAFVSYNFVISPLVSAKPDEAGAATLSACQHNYDEIRSQGADLIIASVHYGFWSSDVVEGQVQLVSRLLSAGVDVVIGHSPHIPQAVMATGGKLALFSLGNFVFKPDYEMPPLAYTSIIAKIEFFEHSIDLTVRPVMIDDRGIPRIDPGSETVSRVAKASERFGTFLDIRGSVGRLSIARKENVCEFPHWYRCLHVQFAPS